MENEKLNTLKEIKPAIDDMGYKRHDCVYRRDIRAEAVRWVKEITREKYDLENVPHKVVITALAKEWIKHFFNLTEEDLK